MFPDFVPDFIDPADADAWLAQQAAIAALMAELYPPVAPLVIGPNDVPPDYDPGDYQEDS